MAKKDYLNSALFLQRFQAWKTNPDDPEILNIITAEHFRPLYEFQTNMILRGHSEDVKEWTIVEAQMRAIKGMHSYDPTRFKPFKFFGRIGYHECFRTMDKQRVERRKHQDIRPYDDESEDEAQDRYTSYTPRQKAEDDWNQFDEIKALSPLHDAVLTAMNAGHGLVGTKLIRPKKVAAATGIPVEIVLRVLREVRMYLGDETATVEELLTWRAIMEAPWNPPAKSALEIFDRFSMK